MFQTIEMFLSFMLDYIPHYTFLRLLFFVYLMAPQTNGAKTLYLSVFRPLLKKHDKEIQSLIDSVKEKAHEAKSEIKSST